MALRNRTRHDRLAPGPLDHCPAPPPHLDALAREVWLTGGEYLASRGLLATGDLPGLACYAAAVSRIRQLEEELATAGVIGPDGKPNPILAALNQANTPAKNWAVSLHLAPYSRLPLSRKTTDAKEASAKGTEWDSVIAMPSRKRA